MNRDQIILQLQQDYMKRREDNLRLYEQRVDEACERCPGLRELLNARHALVLGGIRASLVERKEGSSQQLPNAMNLLNDKIAAALKAGGLSPDTLKPIYTCPICRDEGYLFEPSRHMCTCMERELNRRILGEAGLQDDRQTFENFREEIFSDVPGRNGVSPRQTALLARNVCQAYADSFPNTSPDNLLLTGKSGLGKTYLLCCIAHRLAQADAERRRRAPQTGRSKSVNIQIYAAKKNPDVLKAERFFKERRISYQTMDLKKHKLGKKELELFVRAAGGAQALVDRSSQKALERPVAHMSSDALIVEALLDDPAALVSPIVRNGNKVTIGAQEDVWKEWVAQG